MLLNFCSWLHHLVQKLFIFQLTWGRADYLFKRYWPWNFPSKKFRIKSVCHIGLFFKKSYEKLVSFLEWPCTYYYDVFGAIDKMGCIFGPLWDLINFLYLWIVCYLKYQGVFLYEPLLYFFAPIIINSKWMVFQNCYSTSRKTTSRPTQISYCNQKTIGA